MQFNLLRSLTESAADSVTLEEIKILAKKLNTVTKIPLVRGIDRSEIRDGTIIELPDGVHIIAKKLKIRKDRKPLHTKPKASELVDDWFDRKFGVKPRSQGLFTVRLDSDGNETAGVYGTPVLVYPVGDFDYIFSKRYDDLYTTLNTKGAAGDHATKEKIDKVMDAGEYQMNTNINQASGNTEITILADEYIAVMGYDKEMGKPKPLHWRLLDSIATQLKE